MIPLLFAPYAEDVTVRTLALLALGCGAGVIPRAIAPLRAENASYIRPT
ncbi:MAG: hypothetical protein GDA41_08565 [Rhodospirillales bacterium]|nr:hypothetical protein [Rhodospirillales bacterium]